VVRNSVDCSITWIRAGRSWNRISVATKFFHTLPAFCKGKKFFCYKPDVALGVPGGSDSWIVSIFSTMKMVRSSPLRTGRLHPQEFSWYSFLEAESTPGHMVPSVASENIPSYTTGNRSRDLPTSSTVP
jgi:hypothetical protein